MTSQDQLHTLLAAREFHLIHIFVKTCHSLYFGHFGRCLLAMDCALICAFRMTNEEQWIFVCFIDYWNASFMKCLFNLWPNLLSSSLPLYY